MEIKAIISAQPNCKSCKKPMLEWDAFADEHEHIECTTERVSSSLMEVIKKQFDSINLNNENTPNNLD